VSGFELNYIQGSAAAIAVYQWITASPRYLLLLVHGHSEHIGHYESIARHFQSHGAYVFGPDHPGHGLSQGERLVIEDFDAVVNDVGNVVASVRCQYPDLPLYVVGHSMGGMIATRYVQLNSGEVRGLVLSAPLLGSRTRITDLYAIPQQAFLREGKTVKKGEKVGPFMRRTLAAMERMLMLINEGPGFGNLPALCCTAHRIPPCWPKKRKLRGSVSGGYIVRLIIFPAPGMIFSVKVTVRSRWPK